VWEGDTLAFECRDRAGLGHTIHYVFEPGSFVPVAQAVWKQAVELIRQPVYVFPYDIDKDPVWRHTPAPTALEAVAWYQCDHQVTDEAGGIAWSGRYKAWGLAEETRSEKAIWAEIRNPLRFQGQYFDVETNLHYNRYRYYDPQVGRFIGKDPIGFAGGLNVYFYAPNPTQWLDPLGLAKLTHADDFDTARRQGFKNAGMDEPEKILFSKVDMTTGTVVEFKGPGGSKVAYDAPHADMDSKSGHDKPHVGWQTAGKRSKCGCGDRGNITYAGPQHPHRSDEK
jgi:RHS repeat-associated protein